MKDPEIVRFNILRNALYHTARRRALERLNRAFNFLIVVLGTAAFGDVLTFHDLRAEWIGATVAVIGALQLVFDFGRQARDHQMLQRDYYSLLAEAEAALEPTPDQASEWWSRMLRITADEPPTLRALDAKAYNDAIDAMGWDAEERLIVPWIHRRLGSFIAFEGHNYKKRTEVVGLEA